MATRAEQEAAYQQWLATNPQLQSEEYGPTGDNESYVPGGTRYYFDYNGQKLYWDGHGFSFAPTNDYDVGTGETQYTTGVGTYDKDSGFGALDWKKADRPESGGWINNNMELFAGLALAAMGGAAFLTAAEGSALAGAGVSTDAASIAAAENGIIGSTVGSGAGTGAEVGAAIASPSVTSTALPPLAETAAGTSAVTPTLAQTTAGTAATAGFGGAQGDGSYDGAEPYTNPTTNQNTVGDASSGWDLSSVIRGVTNGTLTGDNLARILTGLYGANRQNQYADNLMNMYKPYAEQANWYGDKLRETYTNPNSYYESPEWQGIQRTTGDYLQRQDAAGGRLSNNFARQARLNELAAGNISNYRSGLSDIYRNMSAIGTGQGMQTALSARMNAGGGLVGTIGDIMSGKTTKQVPGLGKGYYG